MRKQLTQEELSSMQKIFREQIIGRTITEIHFGAAEHAGDLPSLCSIKLDDGTLIEVDNYPPVIVLLSPHASKTKLEDFQKNISGFDAYR